MPIILFLLPIFIIIVLISAIFGGILGFLNPIKIGSEAEDIMYVAVEEIRIEESVCGSIDVDLLRAIDMLDDGEVITSKRKAKSFIEDFIIEVEDDDIEEKSSSSNKESQSEDPKHKTKHKEFMDSFSILKSIKDFPKYFTDSDIELVKAISFSNVDTSELVSNGSDVFDGTLAMPCSGNITSSFGRRFLDGYGWDFHCGIDIGASHHCKIKSVADGKVVDIITNKNNFGNQVVIKHKTKEYGTIFSAYCHLSKINVKKGQKVKLGDCIGLEGGQPGVDPNPGITTGHHLHFEIRIKKNRAWSNNVPINNVDPMNYLSGK